MRVVRRRHAALLAGLALAATSLGLAPASVSAAQCPDGSSACVVVKVVKTVNGKQTVLHAKTVGIDEFAGLSDFKDPAPVQYFKRRNLDGKVSNGPTIQPNRGISLRALLAATVGKNDPAVATFSEAPNAGGIPSVLSDAELAEPTGESYPFLDDLQPAVYRSGGQIGYVRPLRDEKSDVNASDIFKVSGPLELTFHTTGTLLEPSVTVGKTEVTTKTENSFSISYAKKPRTRILRTRWDFGDGSVKGTKRESPVKRYAKKGTYPVAVSVYGADGSYGRSSAVQMTVEKPPKPPKPSTGGSGGGTGSGSGGGTGGGTSGGYVPPYDPDPIVPEPIVPDPVDPPSDTGPEQDIPDGEPTETTPLDDGLEEVEGYVLAGAEIVPGGSPQAIPGTQDSSRPTPPTQTALRKRIATWVLAGLTIALLVGAGAASETRWFRDRLRPLRRRA
ncbi:PKD domain-containing protein [Aeromicrobium chenweiae]|uniref:Uncharacterized protein n=1 Tax=Aeromicrobium chenweiae TaxID=2079793 RepID=A0A2S0WJ86_9ACTN|nr:PKD domain-containing protein [Aeromicrobium chenweiae]AWB91393.1 hypothetical protein C3E78_03695 [Aeromicrobium chenweiae]TGN30676.1 PKD domain-containing protein [Aeromicrobium chenweiae]